MTKPVISVEHLSKAYRIGLKEEIPDTLMGAVTGWIKAPVRNWRRLRRLDTSAALLKEARRAEEAERSTSNVQRPTANGHPAESSSVPALPQGEGRGEGFETNGHATTHHSPLTTHQSDDIVWALRDVSFEVAQGEVVGIIGRNGAGKSTLLKILSRITEPTSGRAVIRGRVASLLEVGTGFHPELTGRENVYMNGTVLGMTKREIDRKFDEIVDFSGVERFLDTPIKRYSSGMQVRLAFAVAAHLEPEILIIDEVLAVGDTEFQTKCLGKMKAVARAGRTVLFVSHNLSAVRSLCSRAMTLSAGLVNVDGTASQVVADYLSAFIDAAKQGLRDRRDRRGTGDCRLLKVDVTGFSSDHRPMPVTTGCPSEFTFHLDNPAHISAIRFALYDVHGTLLLACETAGRHARLFATAHEPSKLTCRLTFFPLLPGSYRLNAALYAGDVLVDHIEAATLMDVRAGKVDGMPITESTPGLLVADHQWATACVPSDTGSLNTL